MNYPISIKLLKRTLKFIKPINKMLDNFGFSRSIRSVVLCYHSVCEDDWEFSLPSKDFEEQIRMLKNRFDVVDIRELISCLNKNQRGKIAITFDDGYKDVYFNALPVLKKYGINACVFVIGELNAQGNSKKDKRLLSLKDIKNLINEGWDVGYHTKTHPNLKNYRYDKLDEEIVNGKKELENKLGIEFEYFAYPFGYYDKDVLENVEKAGFKYSFIASGDAVRERQMPHKLSRVLISKYLDFNDFEQILTPLGLVTYHLFTKIVYCKDNLFKGKKD